MDPLRILVRVVTGYLFLLILLRISGKRTVGHGNSFDFVLALAIGDLADDFFWADVSAAQAFVAAISLVATKLLCVAVTFRASHSDKPS